MHRQLGALADAEVAAADIDTAYLSTMNGIPNLQGTSGI
jgi:hypothetical protein